MKKFWAHAIAWIALGGMAVASAQTDLLARTVNLDIAAQALSTALLEFSKQAEVQVIAPSPIVTGLTTEGVHGQMPIGEALAQLLRGTSLSYRASGVNTIGIDPARSGPRASGEPAPMPVIPLAEPRAEAPKVEVSRDATPLQEITVTATKRAKSIRDIAGSVNAIRGEDLEKMGAQGLQDYIKLVPGVTLPDVGDEQSTPIIRGISTSISTSSTQATSGVFLDDIPLADPILPAGVPDINPFDLDRVEVLKGPVGTLFGADALSGAIRYITRRPELGSWSAKLLGEAFRQTNSAAFSPTYGGVFNIPIGDSLAVRALGIYRRDAGYIDDLDSRRNEKDVNRLRQITYRAAARWQMLDDLRFDTMYMVQNTDRADESFTDQPYAYERADTPFPTPTSTAYRLANGTLTYGFDWATLTASTNYFRKRMVRDAVDRARYNQGLIQQENATNEQALTVTTNWYAHGINEELRLTSPEGTSSPWEWLAGAAYFHHSQSLIGNEPPPGVTQLNGALPVNLIPQIDALLGGQGSTAVEYADFEPRAYEGALFGEVTRKLGPQWEVTGGLRLFKAHVDSNNYLAGFLALATDAQIQERGTSSVDAKGLNPKLAVRFMLNRHVQTYALVSKGFQFGGVQVVPLNPQVYGTASSSSTQATYKSSTLWNYEAGVRTEWLDHRLKLDTTLFYLSWKDLQTQEIVAAQADPSFVLTTITGNIGHAHSEGIEAALSLGPIGLGSFGAISLTSSAARIKAVTDVEFIDANGVTAPPGTRLPGTPHWQVANVAAYELPFSLIGQWQFGLSATHTYLGQSYNDLEYPYQAPDAREMPGPTGTNTLPIAQMGNYNLWDARAHLQRLGSGFTPDLSVSLKNVFGKIGVAGLFTAPGTPSSDYYLTQPRTLLVQLSVPF